MLLQNYTRKKFKVLINTLLNNDYLMIIIKYQLHNLKNEI